MTKLIIKSIPQHPNEAKLPFMQKVAIKGLRDGCPIELDVEIPELTALLQVLQHHKKGGQP